MWMLPITITRQVRLFPTLKPQTDDLSASRPDRLISAPIASQRSDQSTSRLGKTSIQSLKSCIEFQYLKETGCWAVVGGWGLGGGGWNGHGAVCRSRASTALLADAN
jgi:hypothetical protein